MNNAILLILTLSLILRNINGEQDIGDDCLTNEHNAGKCVLLADCRIALNNVYRGLHPKKCGFQNLEPIICCPIPNSLIQRSISEQMCTKYAEFIPKIDPLGIVRGIRVAASDFPHMASLGFANGNEKVWRCGGSLISNWFVLTAAHCLQSADLGNVSWVRLGEQYSPAYTWSNSDFRISELIAHPQYKKPSSYNDIALVKLERVVVFTISVRPACLNTNPTISLNAELVAIGWGLTKFAGEPSRDLQKVDLDLFTEQECMATYNGMIGTRRLNSGIITNTQFCAGGRIIGKDTCQGDSGGPLQIYLANASIHYVVGITSFGKSCGLVKIPAVYTRVSSYLPWIESIVWPDQ